MSSKNSGVPPKTKPDLPPILAENHSRSKNLLVVGVCVLRIRELVEVHHLVQANKQPAIASEPDKACKQLQLIVDRSVVYDRTNTQGRTCICFGSRSLRASNEPHQHTTVRCLPQTRANRPARRRQNRSRSPSRRVVGYFGGQFGRVKPGLFAFGFGLRDQFLENARQGAALGFGARCDISGKFRIKGTGLPSRGVEPPVRVEVGMYCDEFLLERSNGRG